MKEVTKWDNKPRWMLCKTCEQRLKELGKPCAFRILGNEYCWEHYKIPKSR